MAKVTNCDQADNHEYKRPSNSLVLEWNQGCFVDYEPSATEDISDATCFSDIFEYCGDPGRQ